MHLLTKTQDMKAMMEKKPFGPGFSYDQAKKAVGMEVWGTSFTDEGPDFCEARLIDDDGLCFAVSRCEGY